jgi:hypothetical protein
MRKGTINFPKRRAEKKGREYREPRAGVLNAGARLLDECLLDPDGAEQRVSTMPLHLRVSPEELDRVLEAGGLCRGINLVEGVVVIMRDSSPAEPPPAA